MKTPSLILILGLLTAHSTLSFAEEITREQAAELMTQCQDERQEKIAPLKQEEINKCINEQRRDKDQCERRNENFGQNRRVGGSISPGLFWDYRYASWPLMQTNTLDLIRVEILTIDNTCQRAQHYRDRRMGAFAEWSRVVA
jgi:hypothetical protein